MDFTTSQLYNQYNGEFLLYRNAWIGAYFDSKDEIDSFTRTVQFLDLYNRELGSLHKLLKEYEIYVLDKGRDIPPDSEKNTWYFKRQRHYLVYKILRDMFNDTYIEDYPSKIDRDGDWVMLFWDLEQTGS